MAGRDDILADLPAPHADEPPTLRQDIADELADHLKCAAQRESFQHPDPADIERRVLARFGDPRKIARQLWFEAMKEILMSQKILLSFVGLLTVIAATACGLVWSLARDFQTAAQASQAATAELLKQGRDANQELVNQNQKMMQQLTALANRPTEAVTTPDWNPLNVRVVKNDKEKTPAEGFEVVLRGPHFSDVEASRNSTGGRGSNSVTITTDENGVADFGLVHPGRFYGTVTAPWGENRSISVTVKAGIASESVIIAPVEPPEPVQVKPMVKWPKEFGGLDVAVVVGISRKDSTRVDDTSWEGGANPFLLIRPDGRFAVYSEVHRFPSNYNIYSSPSDNGNEAITDTVYFPSEPVEHTDVFPWRGREAALVSVNVVYLPKEAGFPGDQDRLKCLSPSEALYRSFSSQFRIFQRQTGRNGPHQDQLTGKSLGAGQQQWTIDFSESDILTTLTMIAPEQFPKESSKHAVRGSLYFHVDDKDGDNELSEEEWSNRNPGLTQLEFEKYPISYRTFMEAYFVKYRTPDERSRRGSN